MALPPKAARDAAQAIREARALHAGEPGLEEYSTSPGRGPSGSAKDTEALLTLPLDGFLQHLNISAYQQASGRTLTLDA